MLVPVKRLVFWIDGDTVHSTEHWTEVPPRRRNQYEPPGLRRPTTFSLADHGWSEGRLPVARRLPLQETIHTPGSQAVIFADCGEEVTIR